MKTYLIVTAMKEELDGLIHYFPTTQETEKDIYFYQGNDFSFYAFIGGIGKVSMAYKLGLFLANHKIDLIFNVGVAGSISKKLKPFDTLISKKVSYYDVDLLAFGYKRGQMASMPLYYEADEDTLSKIKQIQTDDIKFGLIVSGDSFVTKANFDRSIYNDFDDPLAIDMESGSVAQVCYIAKIPFVIIRTISDDTEEENNDSKQYDNNLEKATLKAGEIIYKVISSK